MNETKIKAKASINEATTQSKILDSKKHHMQPFKPQEIGGKISHL